MENTDHPLVLVKMKYFENTLFKEFPSQTGSDLFKDSKVFCMIRNYFSDVLCSLI